MQVCAVGWGPSMAFFSAFMILLLLRIGGYKDKLED